MTGTLVVGVGNADRGDDAVGLEVVRRVRARRPQGVAVLECAGDTWSLLETWPGSERVIVVDASSGGGPPGTVQRFDVGEQPLPTSSLRGSTHSWGVAEAVEMARALGQLPPRLLVYGVEGRCFEPGRPLSPEVAAAVNGVVDNVLQDIAR